MKEANDAVPMHDDRHAAGRMLPDEQEVARGMRSMHLMVMATLRQEGETAHIVDQLRQRLTAMGIISDAEWQAALRYQSEKPRE